MNDEQLACLLNFLAAGKLADDKLSPERAIERAFFHGWNEGVSFAEGKIKQILAENHIDAGFSPSTAGE